MLILKNIRKDYVLSTQVVKALKGVDLNFRACEFVAILGPSGCGKTTLLNIVGGLDRYTSGDLVIDGKSTKDFKGADWDAYRNRCIGYVFQSYNLIPHLSVLKNVELALTLSGISPKERKQRASNALKKVGLDDQLSKRPNQLSGGQMQRVAIARALVNEPKIILADEPTGALDSKTSVQIMDLLKEIAKDRLVIMVTHNNQIADTYANRIVRLLDGEVEGDSNPYGGEQAEAEVGTAIQSAIQSAQKKSQKANAQDIAQDKAQDGAQDIAQDKAKKDKAQKNKMKRTSMSFLTALNLSFKNLWTKRGRTFSVSFAGSIGIIGIALVLAISNGFNLYIKKLETETLANFPVTVSQTGIDLNSIQSAASSEDDLVEFPEDPDSVGVYNGGTMSQMFKANTLTPEYVAYVDALKSMTSKGKNSKGENLVLDIQKSYAAEMPLYTEDSSNKVTNIWVSTRSNPLMTLFGSSSSNFTEVLNNPEYFQGQYDEIKGSYPAAYNEIALIVNSYNRISKNLAERLGLRFVNGKIDYGDILGKTYKIFLNNSFYKVDNGNLSRLDNDWNELTERYRTGTEGVDFITLTISGVLRVKKTSAVSLYSSGLIYTSALTDTFLEDCKASDVGILQETSLKAESLADQMIYKNLLYDELSDMRNFFVEYGLDKIPSMEDIMGGGGGEGGGGIGNVQIPDELFELLGVLTETLEGLDENIQDEFWSVLPYLGDAIKELNDDTNPQFGVAAYYLYYMMNNGFTTLEIVKDSVLARLGKSEIPTSIKIFPNSFETKAEVIAYLDAWNNNNPANAITYTDPASMLSSTMGNMVDIISYVLIAFAAVSLIVSSIMISIITYVSVIERTKEIGILRSIGARKIDVANVFNAETVIIGFVAGLFGVFAAYLLTIPINFIIKAVAGTMVLGNLAILNPLHALALVGVSIGLTLLSGLVPSFYASKKDPVVALRSE